MNQYSFQMASMIVTNYLLYGVLLKPIARALLEYVGY